MHDRCPVLDQVIGVDLLVAPGVRVRNQDGRQAEERDIRPGWRRRPVKAPGRPQPGPRPSLRAGRGRHGSGRLASGADPWSGPSTTGQSSSPVMWITWAISSRSGRCCQHGIVDRAGALAAAGDQQDGSIVGQVQAAAGLARGPRCPGRRGSGSRSGRSVPGAGNNASRPGGDGDPVGETGQGLERQAGLDIRDDRAGWGSASRPVPSGRPHSRR